MDNLQMAYLAGFFDGEGSIGIYQNSNHKSPGFSLRTQLTQNKTRESIVLMESCISEWGGKAGEQKTLSSKIKLNWQLSGNKALTFLCDIEDYLILKKPQARLAIWWQAEREPVPRDSLGRLCARKSKDLDAQISLLMKELKVKDIDQVMQDQKYLVAIEHSLTQILNYKGV